MERINYVSWAQMHKDVVSFASKLPKIDGVIGIPRSGVIPAAHLATHLNVPFTTISHYTNAGFESGGSRIDSEIPKGATLLLLDDSVQSLLTLNTLTQGRANVKFKNFNGHTILPACLYASILNRPLLYERVIPNPRIFAWNWHQSWLTTSMMIDMDGVICEDPSIFDDDQEAYIEEIRRLRPLFCPRSFQSICTHRLERFRPITEAWLQNHNIRATSIQMYPAKIAAERRKTAGPYGKWKGQVYAQSTAVLFVESCHLQAIKIHQVSQKPVLSIEMDEMLCN